MNGAFALLHITLILTAICGVAYCLERPALCPFIRSPRQTPGTVVGAIIGVDTPSLKVGLRLVR